jgi:hypothetical protein
VAWCAPPEAAPVGRASRSPLGTPFQYLTRILSFHQDQIRNNPNGEKDSSTLYWGDDYLLHAPDPALTEKKNHMNHISDTEDEGQGSTQLKFLETLIDKLLSTMGFSKAKTPNRCSAILWDDQLTVQNTDSNVHNSLPENCLEVK